MDSSSLICKMFSLSLRYKFMKRIPLLFFIVLLFSAAKPFEYSLAGRWQRVGDEYAGMEVEVYEKNGNYEAIMIKVPGKAVARGYKPEVVKWKNFQLQEDGRYVFEEYALWRGEEIYVKNYMSFITPNKVYTITKEGEKQFNIGHKQYWVRKPEA